MLSKIIIFMIILLEISSVVSLATTYFPYVQYPKNVLMGQNFTITFGLTSNVINSTNFEYVTSGTKIVNISGNTGYQGFGGYWLVDKINLTNASELIVSFQGERIGGDNPGIVLYSNNFNLEDTSDGQSGTYEILVAWSGILWLDKFNGWYSVISTLPTFSSGNYTVIFKDVNSSVCVYSITINSSSTYLVKYNTGIPWNSIGYVGIRTDNGIVVPLEFIATVLPPRAESSIPAKYVVYINDNEYTSGYSNGSSSITLRIFLPSVINITFPQYHLYKVITIGTTKSSDIYENFPIVQTVLIMITVVLIGLSIWKEILNKRT
ncbi:hypothetical protein V6M85_08190 [Sulfolobus tengchongensis]|uniref:Thermopsin n=1 Tax=Sulfolobus tengchongensis TaxID=207809 RepID=A0AAX4KX61_9CREN